MSTLFPGYKHVQSFTEDESAYEDEVEECYLTLDLLDVDPTLITNSTSYRLIGLDTPTPYLQLGGTVLKGTPQTLLGTNLLFRSVVEEGKGEHDRDTERNGEEGTDNSSTVVEGVSQNRIQRQETGNATRDVRVSPEIVHFCSTSRRVQFREVTLKPRPQPKPQAPPQAEHVVSTNTSSSVSREAGDEVQDPVAGHDTAIGEEATDMEPNITGAAETETAEAEEQMEVD